MSDTTTIAVIGAGGTALGAFIQFMIARTNSVASIDAQKRQDERTQQAELIKLLQSEIQRISAERDRYLEHLLVDAGMMNEATKMLKQVATTPKEGSP